MYKYFKFAWHLNCYISRATDKCNVLVLVNVLNYFNNLYEKIAIWDNRLRRDLHTDRNSENKLYLIIVELTSLLVMY